MKEQMGGGRFYSRREARISTVVQQKTKLNHKRHCFSFCFFYAKHLRHYALNLLRDIFLIKIKSLIAILTHNVPKK